MRKSRAPIALSFATLACLSSLSLRCYAAQGAAAEASKPAQPPAPAASDANAVVGRLGDYSIPRKDLEQRMVQALRPHEEEYASPLEPVTAEAVLREMLAEKAMSLEGRQMGLLKDDPIHSYVAQQEESLLARMVLEREFRDPPAVDPNQVAQAMKANPKWSREQATAMVQQAAALRLYEAFYNGLVQKFHLQKRESNFAQAAQIHQRLLERPTEKRGPTEFWIKNSQIRTELSEPEKNLPLATYDGGSFTLYDWFQAVCSIAPPRRPADLNTAAGVGKLLERALRMPMIVAEAKARGYDKDAKLRRAVRDFEDQQLFYEVQRRKTAELKEPTADEIKAYYEQNQERFAQAATVKINQIWCPTQEAAQKVKAALDGGMDFEAAKKAYSLQKDEPAHVVSSVGEGLFWADLWKADPNQTIGPVKGFYGSGAKWRIVKILEKMPAKPQAYSEQLANSLKWILVGERQRRALAEYRAQLLQKYPPEIFTEKIKDMDAVQIALSREEK